MCNIQGVTTWVLRVVNHPLAEGMRDFSRYSTEKSGNIFLAAGLAFKSSLSDGLQGFFQERM